MTVLVDNPPIAEVEDGGPATALERLVPYRQYRYEVVPGFFVQDAPRPKHASVDDPLQQTIGLVDTSPERWQNLRRDVARLQAEAPEGVQYKVFFLARHGQGWHNYGSSRHGAAEWEAKWTFLTGDGELTWGPDPELTPLGIKQARAVQACWRAELPLGPPIGAHEMKWYVSPLTRTGQTLLESWGDMLAGVPEVWEDWREIYGAHTCDRRSSKSYIQKRFPMFKIEEGFVEEDELWQPDDRETQAHMQMRMTRALDRVFGEQGAKETYISVTSHSAILHNMLAVVGHLPYAFLTGEMIPVLVKATRIEASEV